MPLADIQEKIIAYLRANHPSNVDFSSIPLDESLLELGIIDSYGVVELVDFLEQTWDITISDHEITKEKMGSINKMALLVQDKKHPT